MPRAVRLLHGANVGELVMGPRNRRVRWKQATYRWWTALGFLVAPMPPFSSHAHEGVVERGAISSRSLGGATKEYVVYLPPSYATTDRRFPSFYILHGSGGSESSYTHMAGPMDRMVHLGQIGEMITVFVDGDNSHFGGRYAPYVAHDLVEHVDSHYRTIRDRNSRGITGKSMGGSGSMRLALAYPEVFSVVVAQAGNYGGMRPEAYLSQPVRLDGILIIHGIRDYIVPVVKARQWDEKLTHLGIDHEYLEHDRGHNLKVEESVTYLSDLLHPYRDIGRLRRAASVTATPGAGVVGKPTTLEAAIALDGHLESTEFLQRLLLDLRPLGIPLEVPLESSPGGGYAVRHTVSPSYHGRFHLPVMAEVSLEGDAEGGRYRLTTLELEVYPTGDEQLFADQLGPEWEVEVSDAELGAAVATVPHEGGRAQAITLPSGYLRYRHRHPEGHSTFGYSSLALRINPGTASTAGAILGVRTRPRSQYINLEKHLGIQLRPGEWQKVSVPLERLGLVDVSLRYLELRNVVGTFHLDDLSLEITQCRLETPAADPARVAADGITPTLLIVRAVPAFAPAGAPPQVMVDLSAVGGSAAAPMLDDGTGGDRTAGDGIHSIRIRVDPEVRPGLKNLEISSTDHRENVARAELPLCVLPPADAYVYRDETTRGWEVSLKNAQVDPSTSASEYEGEHCLAINLKSDNLIVAGAATWEWTGAGEGFSPYGFHTLALRALVTELTPALRLELNTVQGTTRVLPLGEQLGQPGVWQEVHVALDWLARRQYQLRSVSLRAVGRQAISIFYLDEMRFVAESTAGAATVADQAGERSAVPSRLSLAQNHPNPFNSATAIDFTLPQAGDTRLILYDLLGQQVAVLVSGHLAAGPHRVRWDGGGLASGVYLYRLTGNGFSRTRKALKLR